MSNQYSVKAWRQHSSKLRHFLAIASSLAVLATSAVDAQIATGKSKYLGNVYQSNDQASFSTYWNQVTPENAGKWDAVEPTRNSFNWANLDRAYNFARANGYPFKQHTFVWGSQEPSWIGSLSQAQQKTEVAEFMSAYCQRYPQTEQIDVVNEPLSAPASFRNALGGDGATGWDWVIESFRMARQYCPNAELLINEYGIINDSGKRARYVEIINLLKSRGLVDGIGIQSHTFNLISYPVSTLKSNLDALTQVGLPIYVSEWDIDANDQDQLNEFRTKFPLVWEHPGVAGVTLWGYVVGTTWRDNTGLLNTNGTERPALQWLKEYVAGTNNASSSATAVSSSSVVRSSSSVANGNNTIVVRARGVTGDENINLRINNVIVANWRLSTSMRDYIYTLSPGTSGGSLVQFDNDSGSRDVQIDYVQVNGEIRQAEAQTYNTGVYQNGSCGGGSGLSEWLHCNGAIGFGDVTAVIPRSSSSPALSSSSSVALSSSSVASSVCVSTGQQCNWYGTHYPLCVTTQSGWGWEDQRSCITRSTCSGQPSPYGIVGSGSCPIASSSRSSSSSVRPSSSSLAPSSSSLSPSSRASSSSSSNPTIDPLLPAGVENSGAGCFVPELPAYSNLPSNAALPNPFRSMDGTNITTKYDWACRRAEVSKQAQVYELGEKPDPATATVSASATTSNIAVTVQANGRSISFNASIQTPTTGTAPYPAMITMGGSSLNNSALLNRGVAIINFNNNDIAEQTNGGSRGRGKFYTLYGNTHGAGAMTAWSWGVSRLIDALEKTPGARIDAERLGITGCSRNGKGALIAGALDERILLTIPQESGSGGSAAWRVSDAQKSAGQNVQTLSQIVGENVWFRSNFSQFSSTANRLPFDHHQVMGMVAPRALLVIENTSQEWLGNVSTYTASVAAREIWLALGIGDRMGVSQIGNHNHCQFPSSQQPEVDAFVDKFLKGTGNGNTNVVKTDGNFNVDRSRWINWSTPTLQ